MKNINAAKDELAIRRAALNNSTSFGSHERGHTINILLVISQFIAISFFGESSATADAVADAIRLFESKKFTEITALLAEPTTDSKSLESRAQAFIKAAISHAGWVEKSKPAISSSLMWEGLTILTEIDKTENWLEKIKERI